MNIWDKFTNGRFSTRVSEVDSVNDLFNLNKHKVIKDFTTPFIAIRDTHVTIADPFLFVKHDILYLFYEEQLTYNGKGVIRMRLTHDLKNWSKPITVLEESFHLSFPFVFEDNGDIYMIPETFVDLSVRLYKANQDLSSWTYIKTLVKGDKHVDSFLFKEDEIYYLFAPIQLPDNSYIQNLYTSKYLTDEWILHPSSPIAKGKALGRNGGSMLVIDGRKYRPAQNCSVIYGGNVNICEVTKLFDNDYSESLIYSNIIIQNSFYSIGGHHISYAQYKGRHIIATDAFSKAFNRKCILRRLKNKFRVN